jgi:uncharacterized protein (DUF488 family)
MSNEKKLTIFTIGHSNHSVEQFLRLLKMSGVTALADVRSSPFSRHNPQFNKDALSVALGQAGIAYVFVGKELGARSSDPSCYENGQVQYSRLAKTALFMSGIERVISGAKKYQIALMCAEKEPLDCHRTLLVSRALELEGMSIAHILSDGTIEPQTKTMSRLLEMVGLPQEDMFRTREELVDAACKMREQKVAYVDASQGEQVNP